MAAEVIWDMSSVNPVSGFDVSTNEPTAPKTPALPLAEKHDGDETVRHAALTVALSLAVLWFFGAFLFKNVRI
jgi:hypothetical protein